MSSHTLVMEARGLVKRYGQVVALDGADFELRAGEILAVIGDNGAGKSSLIKALSGATIPDEGEIKLDGKVIHFKSPADARREGIETVYQDLAVAPAMSISENLFLGREIIKTGFISKLLRIIDKKQMLEQSVARMNDLKVGIRSMTQAVETLSGGQRQCVAVSRAAKASRRSTRIWRSRRRCRSPRTCSSAARSSSAASSRSCCASSTRSRCWSRASRG
jgi:fructose transport system ATP-binding protein